VSEDARQRGDWWRRTGFREVSLILWAAWNPIWNGVPTDEFDSYAPVIAGLLDRRESTQAIAAELERIERQLLGAEPNREKALEVAELLSIWFEEIRDDA
jgi:hypothetical protein